MMLDESEAQHGRRDLVKSLMVHQDTNMDEVRFQFPEYFEPVDPFESARTPDGEYDIDAIDDAEVEWSTADSTEEDDALSAWIAQHEHGSLTDTEMTY